MGSMAIMAHQTGGSEPWLPEIPSPAVVCGDPEFIGRMSAKEIDEARSGMAIRCFEDARNSFRRHLCRRVHGIML